MQLTANFAVLAAAVAYGSTSVLALPVGGSKYYARELATQVDARDLDTVEYTSRELTDMYLEAREYEDEMMERDDAVRFDPSSLFIFLILMRRSIANACDADNANDPSYSRRPGYRCPRYRRSCQHHWFDDHRNHCDRCSSPPPPVAGGSG